ncbi:hypothetical protein SAMN04487850_0842 [Prevotella aff. ruminicola Tc2-24]|uniref:Uncharacterized protein n=1 Tax=Prevotella aff. ruminicola Tc2-24 TaxID=81582 RepID=A0A1I0MNV7_9BACT|nr:hypothetical protein SAMN04487850_0842 [Prevotella aff. ruminicola Tc2-24]
MVTKLRKVERKTKKLVSFFCRDGVTSRSNDRRVTQKNERNAKEKLVFFSFPSAYEEIKRSRGDPEAVQR